MDMVVGKNPRSSWWALSALALGAFAVPVGCEDFGGKVDATAEEEDEAEAWQEELPEEARDALTGLLEDAWPEAIAPTLERAQNAADALAIAAADWLSAIESDGDSDAARASAQDQWVLLMGAWQEAEVMQIGPAASSLSAVAGEDLRDEVYSWTTVNPCRVDQETVEAGWLESDFYAANLVNVYGIDALETVLFSDDEENSCPPQVPPNSNDAWSALGPDGVAAKRAEFAIALAEHVSGNIGTIRAEWDSDGGDFGGKLARAGKRQSPYDSQQQALNAVFDALFYMETRTKDRKLAWPLGKKDCGLEDCTTEGESLIAGMSHLWIRSNLTGFRTLFTGGEVLGMEDLLISVDQEELANDMVVALDAADAAAAALDMPLEQAIEDDVAGINNLFDATREVTTLLKRDIATVLSLQIPQEAAGDND